MTKIRLVLLPRRQVVKQTQPMKLVKETELRQDIAPIKQLLRLLKGVKYHPRWPLAGLPETIFPSPLKCQRSTAPVSMNFSRD